jgi:Transposase DDE domain group 1
MTQCNQAPFQFAKHFQREVVAGFDGGTITSEAGSLLLRQVEQRTGIVRQFANCFRDYRDPDKIEHRVGELIGQRVYGIAGTCQESCVRR